MSSRPAARIQALTTAGAAITSVTATDVDTKGIKVWENQTFAMWVDISVAGGTSPTLDIDFEWSEDSTNGVNGTWATIQHFTGSAATTVDASMNQITTVTGAYCSYAFPVPSSDGGYIRAELTSGGTSPAYTIDSIYWIVRNVTNA